MLSDALYEPNMIVELQATGSTVIKDISYPNTMTNELVLIKYNITVYSS